MIKPHCFTEKIIPYFLGKKMNGEKELNPPPQTVKLFVKSLPRSASANDSGSPPENNLVKTKLCPQTIRRYLKARVGLRKRLQCNYQLTVLHHRTNRVNIK